MTPEELAKSIDHTLVKAEAKIADIERLCAEAKHYSFASVVVNGHYVPLAVKLLGDSPVKVGTTVGFPLGAQTTRTKVFEADELIDLGAEEIDMVMNVGALLSGDLEEAYVDVRAVVNAARRKEVGLSRAIIVKVIIETGLLTDRHKTAASKLVERAGADFVKTCSSFGPGHATVEDVTLIRSAVSPDTGVKASCGIRTLEQAMALIDAGANRLGTSTGVQIVEELLKQVGPEAAPRREAGTRRAEAQS